MESDPAVVNAMLSDAISEVMQELTAQDKYAKHLAELKKVDDETNSNTITVRASGESNKDPETETET